MKKLNAALHEMWGDHNEFSELGYPYVVWLIQKQIDEIIEDGITEEVCIKEFSDIALIIMRRFLRLGLDPEELMLKRLNARHKGNQEEIKLKYSTMWYNSDFYKKHGIRNSSLTETRARERIMTTQRTQPVIKFDEKQAAAMNDLIEYHLTHHSEKQPIQAIQELGELIQALTKALLAPESFSLQNIYEEIFDVQMLLNQMYKMFVINNNCEESFKQIADQKIKREKIRWKLT